MVLSRTVPHGPQDTSLPLPSKLQETADYKQNRLQTSSSACLRPLRTLCKGPQALPGKGQHLPVHPSQPGGPPSSSCQPPFVFPASCLPGPFLGAMGALPEQPQLGSRLQPRHTTAFQKYHFHPQNYPIVPKLIVIHAPMFNPLKRRTRPPNGGKFFFTPFCSDPLTRYMVGYLAGLFFLPRMSCLI